MVAVMVASKADNSVAQQVEWSALQKAGLSVDRSGSSDEQKAA